MDNHHESTVDHRAGPVGPRARSFERAHWEWAFGEAQRCGRGFACAVLMIEGLRDRDERRRGESIARFLVELERLIEERKQSREVLFGVDGERAYLALLGGDVQDAGSFAAEIIRAAGSLDGSLPPPALSIGIASNEAIGAAALDGLYLETMLCVAADGAEVAAASGGGRWVHTELYGLVQRRLESHGFQSPRARQAVSASGVDTASTRNVRETSVVEPDPPDVLRASAPHAAVVNEPELESGWREILPGARPTDAAIERWGSAQVGGDAERTVSDEGLLQLVLSTLEASGLRGPEASTARKALLPLLEEYFVAERARSAEETRDHVHLLERRIAKLKRQLEQLELRVVEVPGEVEDLGLASTFRGVQGLSPADGQFQMKTHLLEAILHANLELAACSRPS